MVRQIKKRYWVAGLGLAMLLIIGPLIGMTTISKAPEPPPFGYHALKINGKFVSPEVFQEEQNRFFMRWHANSAMIHKSDEERADLLLEDIINRVAVEEYLYHYAKITVSPKDVDDYINNYIKARYNTPEQMEDYMASQDYNSEADLKQGVELYIRKLKCFPGIAKSYGIAVPPVELEEQYQQHVADSRKALIRHILIANSDQEKAKQQANDIYRQLKGGADFAKLAAQYSNDIGTKSNGGLMGPFVKGTIVSEFNEKIFNARQGELIPPFEINSGYEIILVEKFIGFYHSKEEFAAMMLVEKFGKSDQLKKWLEQVKPLLTVEILDPPLKAYRLYRDGQYTKAGQLYEKAYKVYRNENYLSKAGECYQAAKDWEGLVKLGQFGMNKLSGKIEYYLYTAEGLYRTQKVKNALQLMKKAEAIAGNNIYYNGLVIQTYSKLGLEKDAARVRQKASKLK